MLNWKKWTRKVHYWGSFVIAIPILLIIISGLFLQLKKDINWIQPTTLNGKTKNNPKISFEKILEIAKKNKSTNIKSWADINRLDVRIDRGIVKVRAKNNWEIQIDTDSGNILQTSYRRSDIIERIHDGSWFSSNAKYLIFFTSGIVLLILWFTGIYMLFSPYLNKWRKKFKT